MAGVAAQILGMRELGSDKRTFSLVGISFAYLSILVVGAFIVFSAENSCEVIHGFEKGLFFTDASRTWGAIILELFVGFVLMTALYGEINRPSIVNGRLSVLDYIPAKENLSNLLFRYLNAKSRLCFAYPILLFVVSYLGAGIARCLGS